MKSKQRRIGHWCHKKEAVLAAELARRFNHTCRSANNPRRKVTSRLSPCFQSWNRYAYVTNNPLGLVDPMGLYTTCDGMWSYDQVDFEVDGQPAGSDRVLIGPCVWQSLQPWLYPPNYGSGGGGGGGGGGSTLDVASLRAAAAANGRKQSSSYGNCISEFYNSTDGQITQFSAPRL